MSITYPEQLELAAAHGLTELQRLDGPAVCVAGFSCERGALIWAERRTQAATRSRSMVASPLLEQLLSADAHAVCPWVSVDGTWWSDDVVAVRSLADDVLEERDLATLPTVVGELLGWHTELGQRGLGLRGAPELATRLEHEGLARVAALVDRQRSAAHLPPAVASLQVALLRTAPSATARIRQLADRVAATRDCTLNHGSLSPAYVLWDVDDFSVVGWHRYWFGPVVADLGWFAGELMEFAASGLGAEAVERSLDAVCDHAGAQGIETEDLRAWATVKIVEHALDFTIYYGWNADHAEGHLAVAEELLGIG